MRNNIQRLKILKLQVYLCFLQIRWKFGVFHGPKLPILVKNDQLSSEFSTDSFDRSFFRLKIE